MCKLLRSRHDRSDARRHLCPLQLGAAARRLHRGPGPCLPSAARRQGSCSNRRSIARPRLEGLILDALRHNLMRPELVEEFIRAFHEEVNRQRHTAELQVEARRRELVEITRKLDGLIEP